MCVEHGNTPAVVFILEQHGHFPSLNERFEYDVRLGGCYLRFQSKCRFDRLTFSVY